MSDANGSLPSPRSERPQVKHHTNEIPGGLRIGDSINVRGTIIGRRFSLVLCDGIPPHPGRNVMVSFSFHPDGSWILNVMDCGDGHKTRERRGIISTDGLPRGGDLHIQMHIDATRISITLNERPVTRLPLSFAVEDVSHIVMSGEDRFTSLDFDDVWSTASRRLEPESAQHVRKVTAMLVPHPPPPPPSLGPAIGLVLPPDRGTVIRRDASPVYLTSTRPRREAMSANRGASTAPTSPNVHRQPGGILRPPTGRAGQVLRSNSDVRARRIWDAGGEGSVNRMISTYLALQDGASDGRGGGSPVSPRRPQLSQQLIAVETPVRRSRQVVAEGGIPGVFVRKNSSIPTTDVTDNRK